MLEAFPKLIKSLNPGSSDAIEFTRREHETTLVEPTAKSRPGGSYRLAHAGPGFNVAVKRNKQQDIRRIIVPEELVKSRLL